MIFFPLRTDVQVSHFPYGTIAIIFLCWVGFGWELGAEAEQIERFMLVWGDGLHPVQWVTSIFLHAGFVHFFTNMIFLWVFGIVVEGMLGTKRFVPLYLALGIGQCAIEQLLFLGAEPAGSLGASAVIYSLMGISLIWAPKNIVEVFWLIFVRGGVARVTVQTLAFCYLALNLLGAGFNLLIGEFSGGLLHLMGAAIGIAVGIRLLRKEVVDCQGWDWFSVRAGKHLEGMRLEKDLPVEVTEEVAIERIDEELALAEELVDEALADENFVEAASLYRDADDSTGGWKLVEPKLRNLTLGLMEVEGVPGALPLIEEYRERFPGNCPTIDLALGEHLLITGKRYTKSVEVLEEIEPSQLSPAEVVRRDEMLRTAKQKIADGEFEFFD